MITSDNGAVRVAMIHVRELLLHLSRWEHGNVLQPKGLKDVLVTVVVQRHSGDTLERDTSEVDVDTVLPSFSGLEQQWLQDVLDMAGELIEPNGMRIVPQLFIEECITKAS